MGGPASGNYKKRRASTPPMEDADPVDQLYQAQQDFQRFGAVTREDRIALASKFVREADPVTSLQWSKHLEQMEAMVDIAEIGLPPPTTDQEQGERLSRLMIMVGKTAVDSAYELFLENWRDREKYRPHKYRVGKPSEPPDYEPRAAEPDVRERTDADIGFSAGVSQLPGATSDLRDSESPQPAVEAGDRTTAPEDREPIVTPPPPVKWEPPPPPPLKYVEAEDGSEEPDF